MDLNALLQAAMQDPAARDFIGKMVGGGAPAPAPTVDPRQMMAQSLQQAARSGPAPAPAFGGAKQAVDEMLRGFDPTALGMPQPPMPDPAQMGAPPGMPPQGAPMPPPGMGGPPQGQMAPPAGPPGPAGGMDLMSMLMGGR